MAERRRAIIGTRMKARFSVVNQQNNDHFEIGKLRHQRGQRQRKPHLKINVWKMAYILLYIVIITSSSHPYCWHVVDRARGKWTSRSAVDVKIENGKFTVVCSRCLLNLKFWNFTLQFGRLPQRILLKCVPHVQHDYFLLIQLIGSLFSGVVIYVAVVLVEARH